MSFLFWNVRGAAGRVFPNTIKTLRSMFPFDVLVIFEPRVSGKKARRIIRRLGFNNHLIEEAEGFAKRIRILWDDNRIDMKLLIANHQAVTMLVTFAGKSWILTSVYASPKSAVRKGLWNLLNDIPNIVDLPWFVAGDFNEIVCANEKVGRRATFVSTGFGQWIQRHGLADVGYIGQQHTWFRVENNKIVTKVRLDRGLANID